MPIIKCLKNDLNNINILFFFKTLKKIINNIIYYSFIIFFNNNINIQSILY